MSFPHLVNLERKVWRMRVRQTSSIRQRRGRCSDNYLCLQGYTFWRLLRSTYIEQCVIAIGDVEEGVQ